MNVEEWTEFLLSWQGEAEHLISLIPNYVLDEKTKAELFRNRPMSMPADMDAINAAESRLLSKIPVDLASFFLVSNGWHQYGFDEHDLTILPIKDIYSLSAADEHLRSGISGYATCSPVKDDRNFFREEDLGGVVVVSDHMSGCYLLNLIGQRAGESSVVRWHAAPQLFATFSELMLSERDRCLNGLRSMLD